MSELDFFRQFGGNAMARTDDLYVKTNQIYCGLDYEQQNHNVIKS